MRVREDSRPNRSEASGLPDEFLTKEELASRLKVGLRTVESWQQNALLPFLKIDHVVRFYWPEVVVHLREHFTVHQGGEARVRWGEAKARSTEVGGQKSVISKQSSETTARTK